MTNDIAGATTTQTNGHADLHPRTLLVVDDDEATRMLVKAIFTSKGFRVLDARNGAEGVERFQQADPDIVLMDVMMPVMDGFEATRRIRTLDRDEGTPIIMLTGADDIDAISDAFDAGATDFVAKPINWPLISQRIRFALRSSELMREARRNRLRESATRRLAQLGFWIWDPITRSFEWPEDVDELIGGPAASVDTLDRLLAHTHADDRERARKAFDATAAADVRLELELRLQWNGDERIVRLTGESGVEGRDMDRVFGAIQNITDTRRTQALVDYLALHDELTGLGNRRLFAQLIANHAASLRTPDHSTMLVGWIDLTRFHRFNNALGEGAGDALLKQVAQRLRTSLDDGEVARVGGDEFAVLIRAPNAGHATHRFEQVLEALDHPFPVKSDETYVSFSAGLALLPDHATDAADLLSLAQEAQRRAKTQGRRMVSSGEIECTRRASSLDVERELRRALSRNQFHLVYQPQMKLREGRIVGAEALLRWHHPEKGLVSPVEFIPILEETGQILDVGAWVIAEACRQAKRWADAGTPLRIGINLSPRQFLEPDLLDVIVDATRAAGVSSELIELEITESLAMRDPERMIALLQHLRPLGYKIAIDDFGIGHSSLEYLLRFPLDTIKIDRSFVARITDAQADRAIVRAITVIAQTIDATTIAEGIETQRQCDFVEALGVSEIQGYLIGEPMLANQLEGLIGGFHRPGGG